MRRTSRPEVPSIAWGPPRTCVERCWSRSRSRAASATTQLSAPSSSAAPPARLAPAFGYRGLDPRPCPAAAHVHHARRRQTLLWIRYRQTISATSFRRADTPSSVRFSPRSRPPSRFFLRQDARARFRSRLARQGETTFPSRRRTTKACEPRQLLRDRRDDAASAPPRTTSKAPDQPRRRLRATTRSDHRLRRWPLDWSAELRRPNGPERRPTSGPPCCRRTTKAMVPSSWRAVRAPLVVVGASSGGLDAPAALSSRPRPSFRRHPAKGNAFPKTGVLSTLRNPARAEITPRAAWPGTYHYAAGPGVSQEPALQPEVPAPLDSSPNA